MKFIQTINSSANKFAKGMVGIFAIKFMLFGGAFLIQSCQTDEIEDTQTIEQEFALLKFERLVRSSIPRIQNLITKQQNHVTPRNTYSEEINLQNEQEAREALMPIVQGTKELLEKYEINEGDYAEEFEDTNDPRIALVGLAVLVGESDEVNQIAFNFASLLATPTYAMNKQWECIMEAIGLPGGMIAGGMKKMTVKALIKSAAKLAGRALGWVGLAWAIADYTSCMGYW